MSSRNPHAGDVSAGSSPPTSCSDGIDDVSPATGHNPLEDQDDHEPPSRSAASSFASLARARPRATDASTANSPASAIGSLRRLSGRSSKPAASIQHRNDPTAPGHSSSIPKPPWPGTSSPSTPPCCAAPTYCSSSTSPPGRCTTPAPPPPARRLDDTSRPQLVPPPRHPTRRFTSPRSRPGQPIHRSVRRVRRRHLSGQPATFTRESMLNGSTQQCPWSWVRARSCQISTRTAPGRNVAIPTWRCLDRSSALRALGSLQ